MEIIILILQGLANTPIPVIFTAGGFVLIFIGIVGIFEREEIRRTRQRSARFFGCLFLIIGLTFYIAPILLPMIHAHNPNLTITEMLILLSQGLYKSSVPTILAGGGFILIFISIVGIFWQRQVTRQRQFWSAVFGIFFLLSGTSLYVVPPLLKVNTTITKNTPETFKVYFNKGEKSVSTLQTYHGSTTISVSGVAVLSRSHFSDAYYTYTSSTNRPMHSTGFSIWINSKPIDTFVPVKPAFNKKTHIYTFRFLAPGGILTFGVGRGLLAAQNGFFTLTIENS